MKRVVFTFDERSWEGPVPRLPWPTVEVVVVDPATGRRRVILVPVLK